jgi:hypothetical protein
MAGDLMYSHSTEAAKPLPCSVPLAVVLYGAGNHQPVVSRKVTFACDELEDFTDESYVEKEKAKRAPVQKRDSYERYVAVLSKQKWTSSREISRALHICVPSVNRYLHSYEHLFVKRQEVKRGVVTNLWSLKCDPA